MIQIIHNMMNTSQHQSGGDVQRLELQLSGGRFFFFSSRRRHTRWPRDWSSDVCSSDLDESSSSFASAHAVAVVGIDEAAGTLIVHDPQSFRTSEYRSEERRVGKECRSRRSPAH